MMSPATSPVHLTRGVRLALDSSSWAAAAATAVAAGAAALAFAIAARRQCFVQSTYKTAATTSTVYAVSNLRCLLRWGTIDTDTLIQILFVLQRDVRNLVEEVAAAKLD